MKRIKIKFRRRKCGKDHTAIECITDFEAFLDNICCYFIEPKEDNDYFHPLWGIFTPHIHHNMYQVQLIFVNCQYFIFTMGYDNYFNIICPKESLRKRQFSIPIFFNVWTSKRFYVWCYIVWKVNFKRISQEEKQLWSNNNVYIFFHNKVWFNS